MEYIPGALVDLLQGAQIVWVERHADGMTLQFYDGRMFHIVGEFDVAITVAKERLH